MNSSKRRRALASNVQAQRSTLTPHAMAVPLRKACPPHDSDGTCKLDQARPGRGAGQPDDDDNRNERVVIKRLDITANSFNGLHDALQARLSRRSPGWWRHDVRELERKTEPGSLDQERACHEPWPICRCSSLRPRLPATSFATCTLLKRSARTIQAVSDVCVSQHEHSVSYTSQNSLDFSDHLLIQGHGSLSHRGRRSSPCPSASHFWTPFIASQFLLRPGAASAGAEP